MVMCLGGECWATVASNEEEALKALVLAKGLHRLMTRKPIMVFASPFLPDDVWNCLQFEFDLVIRLERRLLEKGIHPHSVAKLMGFGLGKWPKIVFLSPDVMVVRDGDEIFNEVEGTCTDNFEVMVIGPNSAPYEKLLEHVKTGKGINGSFDKILKGSMEIKKLKENYCVAFDLKKADGLVANLDDAKMVLFTGTHPLDILLKEKEGGKGKATLNILEKVLVSTWKENLYRCLQDRLCYVESIRSNFAPLFDHCSSPLSIETTMNSSLMYGLRDSIAIVGISCRFPGGNTMDEFWDLLINGRDAIRTVPEGRWIPEKVPLLPTDSKNSQAGFLNYNVDEFDGKFFGISPMELEYVDPQQRLTLQVAYEALEHAGIDPMKLHETSAGVFGGQWRTDYREALQNIGSGEAEFLRCYLGNSLGVLTARISHFLGLTGPSISTESGCSSSMVAVDLACKSLKDGETDLALACGVNLLIHPFTGKTMNTVLAPDGRCKTFDASADGFGRAEGCAVLVLKRYADAVRDGDKVWGLIRGSAVVQEGASKSLGTPTVQCESLSMKLALDNARVHPKDVSFVEMHGTGTKVGDPLEVMAVEKVYSCERKDPLVIGSVKTNIGHTESCSGIAGIIKVLLAMEHEAIPPHINFSELNPYINLSNIPAEIPLQPKEWKRNSDNVLSPRIAGVSSFGITGTDAHVILQEAPTPTLVDYQRLEDEIVKVGREQGVQPRPFHILTLSAKSEEALDDKLTQFQSFLHKSGQNLGNIAHSANTGRSHFPHRAVIMGKTNVEIANKISSGKDVLKKLASESPPEICFLFPGQGSQYAGMAKALYDHNIVFRMHFDQCDEILIRDYGVNIKDALWGENQANLGRTIYSQTSIFCVEYCLLQLWSSWGVKPSYVMGHSLGEFAAAVAAGILSFADALKLVAERSRLIDALPRGKMLVLKEGKERTDSLIKTAFEGTKRWLDYAAVNSPEQTVLAGDGENIVHFAEFCKNNNIKTFILDATHAFHSRHMDPMLDEYRGIAETVIFSKPKEGCIYVSGMEGRVIEDDEGVYINADYWVRHTRDSVRFAAASTELVSRGCTMFLEIGAQPILSALVMINSDGITTDEPITCLPSIRKQEDNWSCILTSLGKLYLEGVPIDWNKFDKFEQLRKCTVPFYPFQNKNYWFEIPEGRGPGQIHPLVGSPFTNASSMKIFQNAVKLDDVEFLKDHVIGNEIIFPGAGFMELCLVAGHSAIQCSDSSFTLPISPLTLTNFVIESPLRLSEKENTVVQTIVSSEDSKIVVYSKLNLDKETQKWIRHASANFSPYAVLNKEDDDGVNIPVVEEILESFNQSVDMKQLYGKLSEYGLKFGPAFQTLKTLRRKSEKNDGSEVVFELELELNENLDSYVCHPVLIDSLFQAIMISANPEANKLHVPVSVEKFIVYPSSEGPRNKKFFIYCRKQIDKGDIRAYLLNTEGKTLAQMHGATLMETSVIGIMSALESQRLSLPDMYEDVWRVQTGPMERRADLQKTLNYDALFDHKLVMGIEERHNILTNDDIQFNHISDTLYALYMIKAIYDLGFKSPTVGTQINVKQFVKEYNILPGLEGFVRYMFFELEKEGYFKVTNPSRDHLSFKISKEIPTELQTKKEIDSLYKAAHTVSPNEVEYVSSTGKIMAQVLVGKESALPILFPEDPSAVSAEAFYLTARMTRRAHEMGADYFAQFFKDTANRLEETKTTIRILEVGAGTGSFTKSLLPHLQGNPANWEYTYTDLSPVFFAKGQKVFESSKIKVLYKILNIEEDVIAQGFLPAHYDIIIANNVIHATKSIPVSTRNLKNLLRENGTLFISESCKPNRGTNLTFGLLEAYWHYEQYDFEFRGYNCEVSTEKWGQVLSSCGFEKVSATKSYGDKVALVTAVNGTNFKYEEPLNRKKDASQPVVQKVWWVFAEDNNGTVTKYIEDSLTTIGKQVALIHRSDQYKKLDDCRYSIGTGSGAESDISQLLKDTQTSDQELEGIVFLWGLGYLGNDVSPLCEPFLYICKTMITMDHPKLFVVTKNLISVTDQDLTEPNPSPLWAMAKCFQNEHPNAVTRCIDMMNDTQTISEPQLRELFSEFLLDDQEIYVAYRNNQRNVPRFVPWKPQNTALNFPKSERFRLILPPSNAISDLRFGPVANKPELSDNQVECRVKCYALNFRDVFAVMKPIPEFEKVSTVGIDWSGVVTAVGPKVTKVKVGDSVFSASLNGEALPSHNTVSEELLMPMPPHMTFNEAATIPTVAATAYVCLILVAQLKKEDTILIHTGSGGVGLVAIQIAQSVGARIIATAGNKRKRAYLRSLGIQHIFNSRNTEYEHQVRAALGGNGVDVVLNSLTSEGFKEASLALCNKGARFIEMSKLNTWSNEEVKKLRPDVDYTIVDLSASSMEEMRGHFTSIREYMENEVIKPIPYCRFDASEIREALNYLQKAKHIGKIVVTMPDPECDGIMPLFSERSTYLITGGLGGIGLEIAKWMVQMGAKHVALVGRSPPNEKAEEEIRRINQKGKNVFVMQYDVGDEGQCREMLDRLQNPELSLPPLRGIMHAAGVLSDAIYTNQSWEKYQNTYTPKVKGGWNLHKMTLNLPLEHFIMFSSGVASIGSLGQSNHASANFFLDSLAAYRHYKGLPATTVNWGQWGQVGVAANIEIIGLKPFSALQGISALARIMKSQKLQTCVCYADFNIIKQVFVANKRYLEELKLSQTETSRNVEVNKEQFWNEYDSTEDETQRVEVVKRFVRTMVRQILKLGNEENFSDTENFQDLGMDSLMMIEMKNVVQSMMGKRATITVNSVKDCHNVNQLAVRLDELLSGKNEDEDTPSPTREELIQIIASDSSLPETIQPASIPPLKPAQVKSVLITGVTGNMGPYFLRDITQRPDIRKVYCLVREKESSSERNSGMKRLQKVLNAKGLINQVDLSKVEVVPGFISKSKFGLTQQAYDKLSEEVDAVIHLAVKSNFVDEYKKIVKPDSTDMRTINVKGTLNVLEFVTSHRNKLLFHASSIVANATVNKEDSSLSECWPGENDFDTMPNSAYPVSKYVCDRLMANAVDRGIPVKVFRFPAVGGDSSSGSNVDYENNQLMLRMMSYLHLRMMPAIPLPFFILPVDVCAYLSLSLFFDDTVPSDMYNVYNPHPQNETELINIAGELGFPDIKIVEPDEFQARLETEKDSTLIHFLKEASGNTEAQNRFSKDSPAILTAYTKNPSNAFVSKKLKRLLPDVYPRSIESTLAVIKRDLTYAKKSGIFEKFQL